MTFVEVAHDDDASLDELLAFADEHGRARALTGAAIRNRMSGVDAWTAVVLRSDSGEIAAAALGSVAPELGSGQIQLNVHARIGDQPSFDAMFAHMDGWGAARGASEAVGHVSSPTDAELEHWTRAGFERIGERSRFARLLEPGDRDVESRLAAGTSVVQLVDRPELEIAADAVWRDGLRDVPTALSFEPPDQHAIRDTLGIDLDAPLPDSMFVLLDDASDEVLAVALLMPVDEPVPTMGHRLTAVAREHRGRGLATAIKVELIRWAASSGVEQLVASNDEHNAAMRRVNERLGYAPVYRIVLLRRPIA